LDAPNAAVVGSPLGPLAAATAWIAATQAAEHPLPPPAGHIGWLAPTLLAAIRIATSDCSETPTRPSPDAAAAAAVVPTPARVAALVVLTNLLTALARSSPQAAVPYLPGCATAAARVVRMCALPHDAREAAAAKTEVGNAAGNLVALAARLTLNNVGEPAVPSSSPAVVLLTSLLAPHGGARDAPSWRLPATAGASAVRAVAAAVLSCVAAPVALVRLAIDVLADATAQPSLLADACGDGDRLVALVPALASRAAAVLATALRSRVATGGRAAAIVTACTRTPAGVGALLAALAAVPAARADKGTPAPKPAAPTQYAVMLQRLAPQLVAAAGNTEDGGSWVSAAASLAVAAAATVVSYGHGETAAAAVLLALPVAAAQMALNHANHDTEQPPAFVAAVARHAAVVLRQAAREQDAAVSVSSVSRDEACTPALPAIATPALVFAARYLREVARGVVDTPAAAVWAGRSVASAISRLAAATADDVTLDARAAVERFVVAAARVQHQSAWPAAAASLLQREPVPLPSAAASTAAVVAGAAGVLRLRCPPRAAHDVAAAPGAPAAPGGLAPPAATPAPRGGPPTAAAALEHAAAAIRWGPAEARPGASSQAAFEVAGLDLLAACAAAVPSIVSASPTVAAALVRHALSHAGDEAAAGSVALRLTAGGAAASAEKTATSNATANALAAWLPPAGATPPIASATALAVVREHATPLQAALQQAIASPAAETGHRHGSLVLQAALAMVDEVGDAGVVGDAATLAALDRRAAALFSLLRAGPPGDAPLLHVLTERYTALLRSTLRRVLARVDNLSAPGAAPTLHVGMAGDLSTYLPLDPEDAARPMWRVPAAPPSDPIPPAMSLLAQVAGLLATLAARSPAVVVQAPPPPPTPLEFAAARIRRLAAATTSCHQPLPPALDTTAAPPSLPGVEYVVVDLPPERLGAVVKLGRLVAGLLTAAAAAGGPAADGWESAGLAHVTARAVTCLSLVASLLAGSPRAALPLLADVWPPIMTLARGVAARVMGLPPPASTAAPAPLVSSAAVVASPTNTPPMLPPRLTVDVVRAPGGTPGVALDAVLLDGVLAFIAALARPQLRGSPIGTGAYGAGFLASRLAADVWPLLQSLVSCPPGYLRNTTAIAAWTAIAVLSAPAVAVQWRGGDGDDASPASSGLPPLATPDTPPPTAASDAAGASVSQLAPPVLSLAPPPLGARCWEVCVAARAVLQHERAVPHEVAAAARAALLAQDPHVAAAITH